MNLLFILFFLFFYFYLIRYSSFPEIDHFPLFLNLLAGLFTLNFWCTVHTQCITNKDLHDNSSSPKKPCQATFLRFKDVGGPITIRSSCICGISNSNDSYVRPVLCIMYSLQLGTRSTSSVDTVETLWR